MIIILDDSPSMSIRNERGVVFEQAKHAATDILNLMKEGDEVYLIKLSDVRHKDGFTPSFSPGVIQAALNELSLTHETTPFREALGVAAKILADARNFNQEIYLITDCQRTQFTLPTSQDSTKLFDDRVRLFLIDAGSTQSRQSRDNVGVVSAEIKTQIITLNKPVILQSSVRNFSATPVRNSVMSVYLDNRRVVQQSLDIVPDGSATANVSVIPKRRGTLQGYLQLEDDLLDLDNKRFFVMNVPENIRVLLVGSSERDVRLPFLALTLGGDTSFAGLFTTQQIAKSQLSSTDISKYDVLICCNLKDFSSTEAERLARFAGDGGGLMIFPGRESDIAKYNETLFKRVGIPPASVTDAPALSTPPAQSQGFLSFDKIDFAHPLFAGVFEQQFGKRQSSPSVESPRIYKTITTIAGRQGHEIITLTNGSGFLTEYPSGQGRVLLFAVEAGLTWSDFPVKGLFAPLLHRATVYLAAQGQAPPSFTVGDNIKATVRLRNEREGVSYVLRSPNGVDERIVPRFLSTSALATFESSHSSEAGIYTLRQVSATRTSSSELEGIIQAIAVNVDPSESDLHRVDDKDIQTFFDTVGLKPEQVKQLPTREKIDNAVLETRFGVELWKYFIALAVLLALIEMALGREGKSGQVIPQPAKS
jgi:hypothetical protein